MKKRLFFLLISAITFQFYSCESDPEPINDPTKPTIELKSNSISTAPNYVFIIEAKLTDDLGINKVNLKMPEWFLNKTIELSDSAPKQYHLSYQFLTPEDAQGENLKLTVSVEDVGGNITEQEITLKLDRDILKPEFIVKKPVEGTNFKTGDKLSFYIEVKDNKGIDTFELTATELGIDTLIAFNPVNTRYIFVKDYYIPTTLASGKYFINAFASDSTGNEEAITISITVGDVAPDRVYIVGGASFSGWSDPGPYNPMYMQPDPANAGWYEIITYSWGIKDYNNIKFIGQKDWGPLNWGLKSGSTTEMVNSESSEAIVLPEEGYYKVRFNPIKLQFTTEKVEATTPLLSEMYILGSGIVGMDMAWNTPSQSLAMTRDADNPYVFIDTIEFTATGFEDWGANFIFIGDKNNVAEFTLGYKDIPEESLDPAWLDYPGYVVGDLSMYLEILTAGEISKISEDPPASVWNNVPYIAYYDQAGTYVVKMDYHVKQVSITKIAK